jgi:hypothetical protein
MAYEDTGFLIEFVDTQGETAAADVNRLDAASAEVRFPGGATIRFGTITTEAWAVAGANRCKVALQRATVEGGSFVTVETISLPKDANDTINEEAAAVGARVINQDPINVLPGEVVKIAVTQAASDAGGAFRAFIVGRLNGVEGANTAAPVVKSEG